MMNARQHRGAALVVFDQRDLPERLAVVERLAHHVRGEALELDLVGASGQRDAMQVRIDVVGRDRPPSTRLMRRRTLAAGSAGKGRAGARSSPSAIVVDRTLEDQHATIIIRLVERSIRNHAVSTELIFSRLRMEADCTLLSISLNL
jgi:hypothetical protein